MRRLKHQQLVEIHLDGEDETVVPCRVERVEGSAATLESADGDPVLVGNTAPALPGYLVFDHAGRQVALKGIAAPDANDETGLLFVVIDGVQLPERWSAERVEIDAYARRFLPVPVADRDYVDTPLADLSISGMRSNAIRAWTSKRTTGWSCTSAPSRSRFAVMRRSRGERPRMQA